MVTEHAHGFELGWGEHVGFVDGEDRDAAAFGVLVGDGLECLGHEGGVVRLGDSAEAGDDFAVDNRALRRWGPRRRSGCSGRGPGR